MAMVDVGPAAYMQAYSPSRLAWFFRLAADWHCPTLVR